MYIFWPLQKIRIMAYTILFFKCLSGLCKTFGWKNDAEQILRQRWFKLIDQCHFFSHFIFHTKTGLVCNMIRFVYYKKHVEFLYFNTFKSACIFVNSSKSTELTGKESILLSVYLCVCVCFKMWKSENKRRLEKACHLSWCIYPQNNNLWIQREPNMRNKCTILRPHIIDVEEERIQSISRSSSSRSSKLYWKQPHYNNNNKKTWQSCTTETNINGDHVRMIKKTDSNKYIVVVIWIYVKFPNEKCAQRIETRY